MAPPEIRDITIIDAGPSGLFGACCAGMWGASVRVRDVVPDLGGQRTAPYPETHPRDEACMAVNNAVHCPHPGRQAFPGHFSNTDGSFDGAGGARP